MTDRVAGHHPVDGYPPLRASTETVFQVAQDRVEVARVVDVFDDGVEERGRQGCGHEVAAIEPEGLGVGQDLRRLARHLVRIGLERDVLVGGDEAALLDPDLLRFRGQQVLDHRLRLRGVVEHPEQVAAARHARVGRVDIGEGEEVVLVGRWRPPPIRRTS